jgi:hypothetical protein
MRRRLLSLLRALWQEMRYPRRAVAVLLVAALALPGCALSTSSIQHRGTVSLAAAHGILITLDDAEIQLVCGRPGAPQAPRCVPVPVHQKISVMMQQAYLLHARAVELTRNLGNAQSLPSDVYALLAQVQGLIVAIVDLIPQSSAKAAVVEKTGIQGVR